MSKGLSVFCHFSFRRPKGADYGIFAVAFYSDFEGRKLLCKKVCKQYLWEDQQFVAAIQSYEYALRVISEWQGWMVKHMVGKVILVTDNSTLAGWIEDHDKNRGYASYMERAVRKYRPGAPKEIIVDINMCEPRKAEKSYKYCKEENIDVDETSTKEGRAKRIEIGNKHDTVFDILMNSGEEPEIMGFNEETV